MRAGRSLDNGSSKPVGNPLLSRVRRILGEPRQSDALDRISGGPFQSAVSAHCGNGWDKATEFLKVLAINPNNAVCNDSCMPVLLILNRGDESRPREELALSLDPLNLLRSSCISGHWSRRVIAKPASLSWKSSGRQSGRISTSTGCWRSPAYKCRDHERVVRALKYSLPFPFEEDRYKEIERIYREVGLFRPMRIDEHMERYAENNYIGFFDMAFRYMIADRPRQSHGLDRKGLEAHTADDIHNPIGRILEPLFEDPDSPPCAKNEAAPSGMGHEIVTARHDPAPLKDSEDRLPPIRRNGWRLEAVEQSAIPRGLYFQLR